MIVEEVLGNIEFIEKKAKHMEKVYLESDSLRKRILRVKTDHGNEIGIRLKENKDLMDGDIIYMDENNMIVIHTIDDDILTILPTTLGQMGDIAHQLGNRHLPAQFDGDEMLVQYDYLVEELLLELEIPFRREKRKVKQAFRHIGHSHD
ncbi:MULTISPECIES: urease accessory protein UreE [Peribacillus]|uniref:Urease accessory protein UreE n=1 Tax=Peribacillus simplex TaxID=1478 RepID=A0A9W4KUE5_9BACI|nr:urease accessory protein UreE [Peribacillus simplex]MDR4927070.1 urease accessory protein UreE [Peribacillus simplex]WHX92359.1 urease accessory protein UreE [Peribacillus simplex]CAH0161826.1 Urease accessory protein UreE [Peribacillus simplex]